VLVAWLAFARARRAQTAQVLRRPSLRGLLAFQEVTSLQST